MRTQVGIIGAGPAGLLLSHLLHLEGIESVVIEQRSRATVESTIRAGVLEQGTVDILCEAGVGERLRREGVVHHGFEIRFNGERHRVPLSELTGGPAITLYAQHEVLKDLIAARTAAANGQICFEAKGSRVFAPETARPGIEFQTTAGSQRLECDFIAGCDGYHGVSRAAIPATSCREFHRDYPYAWFGLLTATPRVAEELIYCHHEHGFALVSTRSPGIQRLYFQCSPNTRIEDWSDDRVWDELHSRLAIDGGAAPAIGPILQRDVVGLRSFVCEPMQYGRLYLAGDAAHIVPPTGAKGMNLAIADVRILARALTEFYRSGDQRWLDAYSSDCLRRVWRAQRFSAWMTALLHRPDPFDAFQARLQHAEFNALKASVEAARVLAQNYVGWSWEQ
ncbi:MAG: 4-hydroxybenzoate 3-monooxygenase [Gammaproteobacteria bacterium]|nr:4-hydroxybenzoate 3-monooxygenase [Gammaproteobacteria bacterium]